MTKTSMFNWKHKGPHISRPPSSNFILVVITNQANFSGKPRRRHCLWTVLGIKIALCHRTKNWQNSSMCSIKAPRFKATFKSVSACLYTSLTHQPNQLKTWRPKLAKNYWITLENWHFLLEKNTHLPRYFFPIYLWNTTHWKS